MKIRPLYVALILAVVATVSAGTLGPGSAEPTSGASARRAPTHHYIANLGDASYPRRLGFDVFDTGPYRSDVDRLPRGVRALVWLGEKCPTRADAGFRRQVRRLADDRKVFGYFLSDEPHISDCPGGPKALATRARFIRRVSEGRQRSFIVLNQSSSDWGSGARDYRAFRPAVTRVSLVGVDAYPCNHGTCDFSKIHEKAQWAKQYIPTRRIVPVYQAFGQENASDHYYSLPTPRQEKAILSAWAAEFPHPVMDYTYGWRNQDSANPTLVDAPRLQDVLRRWFAR